MPVPSDSTQRTYRVITFIGLCLYLFLASIGVQLAFPQQTTDELAHVSYAQQLRDHRFQPPALQELVMYDALSRLPTHNPNYLNHPPTAYYPLAALFAIWPDIPIPVLRILSALVGLLVYIVYLRTGKPYLTTRIGIISYALFPILLCFPILFALVTPDSLLALGGALVILGWQRFEARQRHALATLTCGILLAGMKLNSLLLVGAYSLLYLWNAHRDKQLHALRLPLVAFAIGALPYLSLMVHWGSPAPDTPGQIALLRDHPLPLAEGPDNFLAYIGFAMRSFSQHHIGGEAMTMFYTVVLGTLAAALLGHAAQWVRGQSVPLMIRATLIGWVLTFAVHVTFSYQRYLQYHWPYDFYPRYYLPVLAGFGLCVAMALTRLAQCILSMARRAGAD